MKSKRNETKLGLKKSTIVNLETKELGQVRGGIGYTKGGWRCGYTEVCTVDCEL